MNKVFNNYWSIWILLSFLGFNASAQSFYQKGLKAIYYAKPGFVDSLQTKRDDEINFDWGFSHPPFVSNDHFSIKWIGYLVPEYSEKYTFSIAATGNSRLYINDSLVITSSNQGSSNFLSGSIRLSKNIQYNIKIEYSNQTIPSFCKLQWKSKSQKNEIIPSKRLIPENAGLPLIKVLTNVIGRDPFVMLGPDSNYYMVETSCYLKGKLAHVNCWDNNDGLHLWKSKDMLDWKDEGLIWSIEENGTWQKKYDERGRRPLWAPEIHYIKSKKNWYVVYSMGTFGTIGIKTGLFRSKSGKPEGPYEDVVEGPIVNGIDGSLFEEDNGDVYFLHDNCLIAKMNKQMTGFTEPFRQLKTLEGKLVGFEGSGIIKINHIYYLFAALSENDMGKGSYDLSIASSKTLYGPYSKSWVALRHGGHGTLFLDKTQSLWTSMFGSDDLTDVFITPSITKMAIETNGKILPLRGDLRAKVLVDIGEASAQKWKYTNTLPSQDWNKKAFHDSTWAEGFAGFGKHGNTAWVSEDIWIRKKFNPGKISKTELANLLLYISYNDEIEVYINGLEAAKIKGFNRYSLKKINELAKNNIKSNEVNILAIHCHKQNTDQFIDAGLITWTDKH